MSKLNDEELLKCIKSCESEFSTLAEIHKLLIQNQILCSIEELRQKIIPLHRDGYLGNEPTGDGVNMYYIIFCPEYTTSSV
ncbi:hypothetical protein EHE19_014810 [Ruminiclostridium herbifermentans]|uniref:Uncharacterized protein n=1 Tax=Ruminiclostridium herbifermentans TaxID=2488810 RepID=A0A4U7JJA6_9FIRM|nr:hypothetical protein [Ruminiclostridium herbifermentans]QNU66137.1 hypothetical protein EHE19_014810 [Ruminiclostridium herbifermentans]